MVQFNKPFNNNPLRAFENRREASAAATAARAEEAREQADAAETFRVLGPIRLINCERFRCSRRVPFCSSS